MPHLVCSQLDVHLERMLSRASSSRREIKPHGDGRRDDDIECLDMHISRGFKQTYVEAQADEMVTFLLSRHLRCSSLLPSIPFLWPVDVEGAKKGPLSFPFFY